MGREFILTFLDTDLGKLDMEIYIIAYGSNPVDVRISTPIYEGAKVDESFQLASEGSRRFTIAGSMRVQGTGVSKKGILISASADIAVYGMNKDGVSCGGYMALPVDALGTKNFALSWWPDPGTRRNSQFAIVATEDNTEVNVNFLPGRGAKAMLGTTRYDSRNALSMVLQKYEVLHVQDIADADLTGTIIDSTKPVAVFSGNLKTNIGPDYIVTDHIEEQVTPVHSWGNTFALIPIGKQLSDFAKIVAKETRTTVSIYQPGKSVRTFNINGAGQFRQIEMSPSEYTRIVSTKPIMVAQFIQGSSAANLIEEPAVMVTTPIDQYRTEYVFLTPGGQFLSQLYLVVDNDYKNGLILDNQFVSDSGWKSFPGSEPLLVGKYIEVSGGRHTLRHQVEGIRFGAHLYGVSFQECGYAYPAGMCLLDITGVCISMLNYNDYS